jgi:hypothetical protein
MAGALPNSVHRSRRGRPLCAACVNGGNGSRCDEDLDPNDINDRQWIVEGAQIVEEAAEPMCAALTVGRSSRLLTGAGLKNGSPLEA